MKFNPDTIKIERYSRLSDNLKKQERLLEIINKQKEDYAPNEENFIGLYSEEEVLKDIAYKNKFKARFAEQNKSEENPELIESMKRVSDIYEGVIVDQAERNAWFGEHVNFYATSEYDDIINGVDGVAEFIDPNGNEQESHVAMSFDVVFSKHALRVEQKLDKTKKLIDEGHLTEVKYFENDQGEQKALRAPRIILGSRLVSAEKLIDLWGSKVEGRNKKLAEHPVQIKLLLETYLQAHHFYNYAQEVGQNEIAYSYAVLANKVSDIINNEKQELMQKYFDEVSEDIVFEAIRDYCKDVQI